MYTFMQWRHQGGHEGAFSPNQGLCLPLAPQEKMVKISHFRESPSPPPKKKHIFPSMPPPPTKIFSGAATAFMYNTVIIRKGGNIFHTFLVDTHLNDLSVLMLYRFENKNGAPSFRGICVEPR